MNNQKKQSLVSLTKAGIKRYAKKGYAEDAYKQNKTVVGKAYDKITGAHKITGEMQYDRSTSAQNKQRAEKYISDEKSRVKKYTKTYEKASSMSDIADKKWNEVSDQYKKLGKNKISRMINAAKGTSVAAKKYSQLFEEASSYSDKADVEWEKARKQYREVGKNAIDRILKVHKYG